MSRRVLAALAAATLMLGASACGEEGGGPVTTPPPPVENGPSDGGGASQEPSDGGGDTEKTDEPTVAAPDVPAPDPADYPGMDEETPEGAEQALRYYIAVVYWGYQTGETETLGTLYTDNCEQCKDIVAEIDQIHETSTYWNDVPVTPVSSAYHDSEEFDVEASYGFLVGAHKEPTTGESEPTEVAETPYTAVAGLNWSNGAWLLGALILAESQHAE